MRLKLKTRHLNKSLISVANKPALAHIIDSHPIDCECIIATGHAGNLVRDFVELTYPNRNIRFVDIQRYEGMGSGLGHIPVSKGIFARTIYI